jgi:DEAD/DEAH box helicase domain-containing protein
MINNIVKEINIFLSRYGSRILYKELETYTTVPDGPAIDEVGLPDALTKVLKSRGLTRLYKFQYEALNLIRSGKNLMIVSGTGTGKTEAFLIPIMEKIVNEYKFEERPSVLLIYPTKALARDQLLRVKMLAEGGLGIRVSVLDGDTPRNERIKIYADPPHILITNPDMLHVGMAFSDPFKRLISKANIVVLDEVHVYKGVFGSHVRWILYRLKTLVRKPLMFIGSGATIGNPEELGRVLFDDEVNVIEGPRRRGSALHLLVDQGRVSRWTLAAAIIAHFVKKGKKVLGFVDSQQMAELVARIAMKSFGIKVGVHRAGLLPEDRRRVEEAFWSGKISAVISTPTLELGIDIGDLDVVVMPHLPRSFASYIQRAGRVGRREKLGIVITILGEDPIEAYFSRRPDEFFRQEVDPSYIEPYNTEVLKIHLAAMTLDRGVIKLSEIPESLHKYLKELEKLGVIKKLGDKIYPKWENIRSYLSSHGNLRSTGPQVKIYENNKLIGYREMPLALYDLYPGAIYYHGGRSYVSIKLDLDTMKAHLRPLGAQINMYTRPLYTVDLVDIVPVDKREAGPLTLVYGDIKVLISVEGYIMRDESSGASLGEVRYEKPLMWSYWTKGVMTRYPSAGIESLTKLISGYHALEHVLISASKPVVGASDTDLGGISYPTGHIIIYDSSPGGHGASRLIFERYEKIEDIALKILGGCTCEDGCPKCVYSPYCGSGNRFLSRRSALRILSYTLQLRGKVPEKPLEGRPLA